MSKTIARRVVWGLLILSTASSYAQDEEGQALEQQLSTRIQELEQKVDQLSQQMSTLQTEMERLTTTSAPTTAKSATIAPSTVNGMKLSVDKWQFREVQVKFNTYYALDLVLHNSYDKTIRDIDGRVKFKNLLGRHLYSVSITENLQIPANETVTDEGTQDTGRLLGRGHQMLHVNAEEVMTELAIRKIVFEDGSILEF